MLIRINGSKVIKILFFLFCIGHSTPNILHPILGIIYFGRMLKTVHRTTTMIITFLERKIYEEQLETLCIFSLERKKLQGIMRAVIKYLKRHYVDNFLLFQKIG